MNELEEIQSAIEKLTSGERANLAAWLRRVWGETGDSVGEPASAYRAPPEPNWMTVEEYLEFERASPDL